MEWLRNHMKKIILYTVVLIFVAGFISPTIIHYFVPNVTVAEFGRFTIKKTVPVAFEVVPKIEETILFQQGVFIEAFNKKIGERFEAGEKLFKVSSASMTAFDQSTDALLLQRKRDELYRHQNSDDGQKQIQRLSSQLEKNRVQYKQVKTLVQSGAASQSQLEAASDQVKQLEVDIEAAKHSLALQRETTERAIAVLKEEIEQLTTADQLSQVLFDPVQHIDPEGYFIAPKSGVVVEMDHLKESYKNGEPVCVLAFVETYEDTELRANVNVREVRYLQEENFIRDLKFESSPIKYVGKISTIGNVAKGDTINVSAKFTEPPTGYPGIYQSVTGNVEIERKCNDQIPTYALPISSIVATGDFRKGAIANAYGIVMDRGILGIEQKVVSYRVRIEYIGDQYVEVSFMDDPVSGFIITNPSYRLHPGSRVYSEELTKYSERM